MAIDYGSIGARIRFNRTQNHLSQERLAELTNLSNVYVSYIERGERAPSLESIINIANALGVSADDLLCDSLIVSHSADDSSEFAILYDCSSEEYAILTRSMQQLKDTLRAYKITK